MKRCVVALLPLLCWLVQPAFSVPKRSIMRIETTKGVIVVELNNEKAPATVQNVTSYIESGFYDNSIFHRVIPEFMIQGGGFTSEMKKKETKSPVKNEANNGLKNNRGTIAMARTNDPHSATAQFFINLVDNDGLNHSEKTPRGWGYCVFGKVIEGMDVVDAVAGVKTTAVGPYRDVPAEPVIMKKVTLEKSEPEEKK